MSKNSFSNALSRVAGRRLRGAFALGLFALIAAPVPAAFAQSTCYFGECLPGATRPVARAPEAEAPAASGETRVLARRGNWSVVAGNGAVYVINTFDTGAKMAIVKKTSGSDLVFRDPTWGLVKGYTFSVKITIDGATFTGTGKALDRDLLVMENMKADFIARMLKSGRARFEMANSSWTFAPAGATAAIDAAVEATGG